MNERKINFHFSPANTNIPPRHHKRAAVSSHSGTEPRAHGSKSANRPSPQQQNKKRNTSRIQRSKRYFQQKRREHRNNNNGHSLEHSRDWTGRVEEAGENIEVVTIAASSSVASPQSFTDFNDSGSPAISVSDYSSND